MSCVPPGARIGWFRLHIVFLLVYLCALLYVAERLSVHDRVLLASAEAATVMPGATEYAVERLHEELREMREEIKEVRQEHATLLRWVMTTLGAIVVQLVVYVGKHTMTARRR